MPNDETMGGHSASRETETMLAAGTNLGPYQIAGPLGKGGMGRVYRAIDTRLGRPVAIKISITEFEQRSEREARVISALNHPHICTLYDIGSLPSGGAYLVTEFVDGETLGEWLERRPAADRKIEVARQILEALRTAHAAGIIHRDIKPSNIMIRRDGYTKVLDFVLAKRIPGSVASIEGTTAISISVPGRIIGTVAYMSPEQILGQTIDGRSDLFAFGIILYQMMKGAHPWPRQSVLDTMHAILYDEPTPVEGEVARVVEKLLRKDRDERFPSAEAVLEALAHPRAVPSIAGLACSGRGTADSQQVASVEVLAFTDMSAEKGPGLVL